MAETLDIGGDPEGTDREKKGESDPGTTKRDSKEKTVVVEENDQALGADDDGNGHQHFRTRPVYKRPAFLIGAIIVVLLLAVLGIRYWLYSRSHETTDDAFIDGHIIQLSSKVSGYVARIYITDNQQVRAGDLLAELDARDYQAKVT